MDVATAAAVCLPTQWCVFLEQELREKCREDQLRTRTNAITSQLMLFLVTLLDKTVLLG